MTDRPIIFSGPMVRAILDGRKTQDRRLAWLPIKTGGIRVADRTAGIPPVHQRPSPWQRVKAGDRLWVRETWWHYKSNELEMAGWPGMSITNLTPTGIARAHVATVPGWKPEDYPIWRKRPSIHMPRWASRLTLTVTDVRRQMLQDISEEDAEAEGVLPNGALGRTPNYRMGFWDAWNTLHTKPGTRWEDNPEVLALTFTAEQRNIDG